MFVSRLGCVSQGQYNSPGPQLFVPVHTLTADPVPRIFIDISAWMGERGTEREVSLAADAGIVWAQEPRNIWYGVGDASIG